MNKLRLLAALTTLCLAFTGLASALASSFAVTSPQNHTQVAVTETSDGSYFTVKGKADPNSEVVWDIARAPDEHTRANSRGEWSFRVDSSHYETGKSTTFWFRQGAAGTDRSRESSITVRPITGSSNGNDNGSSNAAKTKAPSATQRVDLPFGQHVDFDFSSWLTHGIGGIWYAIGGRQITSWAGSITKALLSNPTITHNGGGGILTAFQALVDYITNGAVSVVSLLFTVRCVMWMMGADPRGAQALPDLGISLVLLAFYRYFIETFIKLTNTLSAAILDYGPKAFHPSPAAIFASVNLSGIWLLVAIFLLIAVIALAIIRLLGVAYLLVLYVIGPFAIPCLMLEQTRPFFKVWAQSFAKVACWPIAWVIELKVFVVLVGVMATSGFAAAWVAPFATVGMAILMIITPKKMPGPSMTHGMGMARAGATVGAGYAVERVALMGTGGTAAAAKVASTSFGALNRHGRAGYQIAGRFHDKRKNGSGSTID